MISYLSGNPDTDFSSDSHGPPRPNLVAVVGPTASGKTGLAVQIADKLQGEIISADSRQVYRGMDIGSGKDLQEYRFTGKFIPYHLIDIVSPMDGFSVFDFQRMAYDAVKDIRSRGRLPVLCGGTGMYVDSVLRDYRMTRVPVNPDLREELSMLGREELVARLLSARPDYHTKGDFQKRERLVRAIEVVEFSRSDRIKSSHTPDMRPLVLYVEWPRGELRERIRLRLSERIDQGLIHEVQRLLEAGVGWERLDTFGLEYRYVARHLKGELGREQMTEELFHAICRFAKRQETWFRGMEKKGVILHRVIRASWDEACVVLEASGLRSG